MFLGFRIGWKQILWGVSIAGALLAASGYHIARAASLTFTPNPVSDYTYPSGTAVTVTCDNGADYLRLFNPDGSWNGAAACSDFGGNPLNFAFNVAANGLYTLVEVDDNGQCNAGTLTDCQGNGAYIAEASMCIGAFTDCGAPGADELTKIRIATSWILDAVCMLIVLAFGVTAFWASGKLSK